MYLNQLKYFKATAELEHYTKAAKANFVSQPCLSRAISDLEEELGVPLFQKNGRSIKLTNYGKEYLKYVDMALNALERGEIRLQEMKHPNNRIITISTISSLSNHFLPELLSKFLTHTHNCSISFITRLNPTSCVINDLRNGSADLGFGSLTSDSDMTFHPVATQELVFIVPTDHPWAKRKKINIEELEGVDFISYTSGCGTKTFIEDLLASHSITPNIIYRSTEDAMTLGLVSAGLGVAIIPKIPISKEHKVAMLEIENIHLVRDIYFIYPQHKPCSPQAELFKNYLLHTLL